MRRYAALLLLPLLALSACSNEPSNGQLEKLVKQGRQTQIEQMRQVAVALGGAAAAASIKDFDGFKTFEKKSCTALNQDKTSYACTFTYSAVYDGKPESGNGEAMLNKGEKGWTATVLN